MKNKVKRNYQREMEGQIFWDLPLKGAVMPDFGSSKTWAVGGGS